MNNISEREKIIEQIKNKLIDFNDELNEININELNEEELVELVEICENAKHDIFLMENLKNNALSLNDSIKQNVINEVRLTASNHLEDVDRKILEIDNKKRLSNKTLNNVKFTPDS